MSKITNRPPHLFMDDQLYFITNRIIDRRAHFSGSARLRILQQVLRTALGKYFVTCQAYVLLPNHYHLICRFRQAANLPRFINCLHANSARLMNKQDNHAGRKVWFNYWDRYIRDERSFFYILNYIHLNPLKHGLTDSIEETYQYPFSSLGFYLKNYGKEWVTHCFRQFPPEKMSGKIFGELVDD